MQSLSKQETIVGAFFVRVLRILQFNVHCIMQAVIKPGETFSMESIGCAIYTSMAFLNHSCNPNTIKYWEGDRIILVASQPIRKGDEITDNYGMHFLNNHKAQRQDWLQECYWFQCNCSACLSNHPTRDMLSESFRKVECSDKYCSKLMNLSSDIWTCSCGQTRNNSELRQFLSVQVRRTLETSEMEGGNSPDFLCEVYRDVLEKMYKCVQHPWKGLVMPEQLFWKAIRMRSGNKRIC